ncbi:hypothetical protein GDO81_004865 [Engystomops pustulosus]|uniref:Conserved oligomeric Golgi complex subunit 6 n=1 Tax=Engystomops pustulosus TaxID=76066 RepID=A0AAV7CIW5_ENGPU|nr:hypothetical protein GDO81_004865 [Engystomops pustulosus]
MAEVEGNGATASLSASTQSSNPLSRKLNKILETRLDSDKEMLEALKALSTFFTENSLRSRRNLRGDIERRSLSINEDFVAVFKTIKEDLESINEDVQAMSNCCQDMTSRLKASKEQTQDLIVKTTKLQAEKISSDNGILMKIQVQFDRYLAAPDNLQMPQLNFFLSATVKEQIIKQSTELVCRAYSELYDAVTDPTNTYKEPTSILHRSPQQVQTLLS